MIRRTLGQLKSEIARIAAVSGLNASDLRTVARINSATEELMAYEDWPGIVDRYLFKVTNGHIVLPFFLDRIMGVRVNGVPYSMRSPWFEFVEYGPGYEYDYATTYGQPGGCWNAAVIDRDETPLQTAMPCDQNGPWHLYVKAELNEPGARILACGRLANGREVRSADGGGYINGEYLSLDMTPSTALFSDVTQIVKPETNGYVELWATNGNSADDIMLAAYAPQETDPSYHAYFLPTFQPCQCPGPVTDTTSVVMVRGRKRFIPVENDNDNLVISNLPAMTSMVMAIQKRETSDPQGYAAYKQAAIDILRKEATSYRGKAKTPAITFLRGASFGQFQVLR